MTIDEHIKHIQGTIEWAKAFGGEDDDNLITMWAEQLEMLEELNWFRKQDLIRREDVKNDEVLKEIALGFEREFLKTVMMIPKAEYRGESNED